MSCRRVRNFNVAVRESGDESCSCTGCSRVVRIAHTAFEVGRLAGLPAPVIGAGREVLALLETGHHVAHQPPPPMPDAQQLALFTPAAPHPLLAELEGLDVNALSPLDALNRLAAWKKQLAEES